MKQIDEKTLLLAVGEVGDDLIARAERRPARRSPYAKWGAMAACFCLIAALAVPHVLDSFRMGNAGYNGAPPPDMTESANTGNDGTDSSRGDDPAYGDQSGEEKGHDGMQGVQETEENGDRPLLIHRDETSVRAVHIVGGHREEVTVEGEALQALKEWAEEQARHTQHRDFEEGQSPGDSDGGEIYLFQGTMNAPEFAYVINGPEDCYILQGSDWFAVMEPSDPPVDF